MRFVSTKLQQQYILSVDHRQPNDAGIVSVSRHNQRFDELVYLLDVDAGTPSRQRTVTPGTFPTKEQHQLPRPNIPRLFIPEDDSAPWTSLLWRKRLEHIDADLGKVRLLNEVTRGAMIAHHQGGLTILACKFPGPFGKSRP